ncbi:hypothetical protein [Paractinoplanes atraurantiacus]|uniref:Phage-related protein n=1 Tax=Paractinoplanes atraurantiacus TaxID=1036182 RepID=A0A285H2U5_9ACTN|nr:hypothetical protein [Actinoplanes atraurantiacus]SNY29076.1 hypothetical protein SAMN05421748_103187 [Actinoplanes atraurantiacus]
MSDTSVVFNVLARDRASRVFRQIHRSAAESGTGIAQVFGPALMPVLAGATSAVAGLAGALMGAGAAGAVFGGVFKSAFSEMKEASDKSQDLRDKITLLNEQIRVANATGIGDAGKLEAQKIKKVNELMARYNLLPPTVRGATMAYDRMKDAWQGFVDKNKPAVYSVMTKGFNLITRNVGLLQPLFNVGADAAKRLVRALQDASDGGGLKRFIGWLTGNAGMALNNLGGIIKNLGVTLYNVFKGFAPTGQGILSWLNEVTAKWAAWSAQTEGGGLQAFVAYATAQGPQLVTILGDIASTGGHIAQAVAPLAPISLAIAKGLAAVIAALPPGVLTALVAGWVAYSAAVKAYRAYVVVAGVATKAWAVAQWALKAALVAANFARAAAQVALYVIKVTAVSVATKAWAAAQWIANGAMVAANFARATAQIAAYLVKMAAIQTATKIWAAVQWVLNLAMWANPITWIIAGIVALIAVIVLIATKTDWFQRAWKVAWNLIKTAAIIAWNGIKAAASAVWNFLKMIAGFYIKVYVGAWNVVRNAAGAAWNWIKGKISDFHKGVVIIAGKLSSKLGSMWDGMKNGFKSAINWVISKWNSISFKIPSFSVFGKSFGGGTIGVPNIPYLDVGGHVQRSGMAVIHKGETVTPAAKVTKYERGRGGGGGVLTIDLRGADTEFGRFFLKFLRDHPSAAATARVTMQKA